MEKSIDTANTATDALSNQVAEVFDTVAALRALSTTFPIGSILFVKAISAAYRVIAAQTAELATDMTTAGGVKLKVLSGADGYDLYAFGAVGNESTNDSAAVQKWLNRVISSEGCGIVPAGTFLLNSAVTYNYNGGRRFTLRGLGEGASRFVVPASNTTGGIIIKSYGRGNFARFHDFSIWKRGTGGIGLWFEETQGGNQHIVTAAAWNLTIRSYDRTSDYFDTFLALRGGFQTMLDNITVEGPFLGPTAANYLDSSISHAAAVGIDIAGAYGPNLGKLMVQNVRVALSSKTIRAAILSAANNGAGLTRVTLSADDARMFLNGQAAIIQNSSIAANNGPAVVTRITGNDTQFDLDIPFRGTFTGFIFHAQEPESFYLREPVFNQVDVGVDFVRYNGREPNLWCNDGHINFRTAGIRVQGAQSVVISGMSIYNEDENGVKPGNPVDVSLVDCLSYVVTNNTFDFVRTSPRRINVFVDNIGQSFQGDSGDHGIIANNSFKSGGLYGVRTSSNTSNVQLGPNLEIGPYSGGLYSDVSTANVVIMPFTAMQGQWVPNLLFGGGNVGIAYASRSGKYTMSGGMFHYEIEIALSNKGTSTGTADVSLPTFYQGPHRPGAGGTCEWSSYAGMTGISSPNGRALPTNLVRLTQQGTSAGQPVTNANFNNNSVILLSGSIPMVSS